MLIFGVEDVEDLIDGLPTISEVGSDEVQEDVCDEVFHLEAGSFEDVKESLHQRLVGNGIFMELEEFENKLL